MLARLRQREAQLALADARGDEAAAGIQPHRLDRVNVGGAIQPKGDDARGMGLCGRDQPVAVRAVMGHDRDTARLQSLEDLPLGVGDRRLVAKELGVRGRDRGDDRDVRADQRGQVRQLARVVHPHLEHARARVGRHPRQAERHAGMVVVALDRAMHLPAPAPVEAGEQRLLRAGLADRAGDADDRRRRPRPRRAAEILQRREAVGNADVGPFGRLGHDRARRTLGERLIEEAMPVGRVTLQRDEQVARPDFARVEGDAGDREFGGDGAAGRGCDLGGGPERQRPAP